MIWTEVELEDGSVRPWTVGPLTLWLQQTDDELLVATGRDREPAPVTPPPNDLEWGRWVVGEDVSRVLLRPALPDRPLVVRPETPVTLPPGRRALFYVSVPVWCQVLAPNDLLVCEVPSVVLSSTWFGDPVGGELCYALRSRARRRVESDDSRPHRATCPVTVSNESNDPLHVDRLCLPVTCLGVWGVGDELWTDAVSVAYRGEEQRSRVRCTPSAPEREGAQRLSSARTQPEPEFVRRSFQHWSDLAKGVFG